MVVVSGFTVIRLEKSRHLPVIKKEAMAASSSIQTRRVGLLLGSFGNKSWGPVVCLFVAPCCRRSSTYCYPPPACLLAGGNGRLIIFFFLFFRRLENRFGEADITSKGFHYSFPTAAVSQCTPIFFLLSFHIGGI